MASSDEPPTLHVVPSEGDEDDQPLSVPTRQAARRMEAAQKRQEAMSLKIAGLTWEQISTRMEIPESTIRELVLRNIERTDQKLVDEMRSIENARLDRAQSAIWTRVIEGDTKAIDTYLRISARRAKLNGLDMPIRLDMSLTIRNEMEQALHELESMVLGDIVQGEVLNDSHQD